MRDEIYTYQYQYKLLFLAKLIIILKCEKRWFQMIIFAEVNDVSVLVNY